MKNLILVFIVSLSLSFISCGQNSPKDIASNDNTVTEIVSKKKYVNSLATASPGNMGALQEVGTNKEYFLLQDKIQNQFKGKHITFDSMFYDTEQKVIISAVNVFEGTDTKPIIKKMIIFLNKSGDIIDSMPG